MCVWACVYVLVCMCMRVRTCLYSSGRMCISVDACMYTRVWLFCVASVVEDGSLQKTTETRKTEKQL